MAMERGGRGEGVMLEVVGGGFEGREGRELGGMVAVAAAC